ncbi:pentatricopeptide repeat-containing protein DOT4, chloroplastic-like [Carica papaya]|uniref:pentatricopeptide repeat-containing protein DOT4, chloroplastic-like n=1 Tax=Carica papaya TaxID=3649 RepID=UPI000B8CE2B1|nr:pentatricopeptide repeat-containing protein DOT4, chloroplastic-like [Carica papaya]
MIYGYCVVFDEMRERDVVSWNTLLGVFSVHGFSLEAINLFSEMNLRSGFRPNMVTLVSLLPVCAELEDEVMVRQIHGYSVKVGLDLLLIIGNSLVDTYGKCRNSKASKQVFEEMAERNEVSWNTMINSFAYMNCNEDALDMFRMMIKTGIKPDSVTISSLVSVLAELECLNFGKEIHGFCLRMGIESDIFVANSLVDMYAKSGQLRGASNVFCKMGIKNVVSWNAMVANFARNGLELDAVELVREMQTCGEIPDSVTLTNLLPACARAGLFCSGKEIHARIIRMGSGIDLFLSNALIDMYAKCDCLNLARRVFDISLRDKISYNSLIISYSQTNNCAESLILFSKMGLIGMKHDMITFVGVISACANLAAIKQGKEIHALSIRKYFHTHLFVANSLLDFYTKCGRIHLATKVFDRIVNKDAASWNTMILGYGMLGELDIAINLFQAMKEYGVKPDSVTYIAMLSACSHKGLVEKGKQYFKEMKVEKIKQAQVHYACMIDLLGRAGHMVEAVELIKSMPVAPGVDIWGALLGACRIHGNIELGSWAAENLFKLKPQNCGYYVLVSNMYAEAGEWDEASKVRELMKSRGTKKNPGCSWVQIRDQVHAFVNGERMLKLNRDAWLADIS